MLNYCYLLSFKQLTKTKNIMKNLFYVAAMLLFTVLVATSCTENESMNEKEFEKIRQIDKGDVENPRDL